MALTVLAAPDDPLAIALAISLALSRETDPSRWAAQLAGLAIEHAGATRARLLSTLEAEAELSPPVVAQLRAASAPVLHPDGDALWVPLHGQALLGVLWLEGITPSADHLAIAELIAATAAVALAHAARDREDDRRIFEEAQRQRLELALRGSNVGVWDFDLANGDIATAPVFSVNMWEPLGYGRELPVSRWHTDRWHPDDGPRLRAAIDDHLSGKTPEYELELRFRHSAGHYTWHLTRGLAQRRPDGTPYRFTGIAIDLTERKQLEQQLRDAKDAAEAANRAKDLLVANVSHEIRTPMNVILGMTELALDSQLTDDQRLALSSVRSAAENLLVVIDDLLDFAKIAAGKLALLPADFGLRAVVHELMRTIAVRAREKQLELACEVADAVPEIVHGDAGRLRQVLINLVDNAIKFTARGVVRLRVEPADDGALRFIVQDTGIGIAPDVHARIFEAFEQADASTTKHYGGTGLGLTIAARLVALMGGAIDVASRPGHGSTFAFTARLPAAQTAAPPQEPPPQEATVSPLRVLVAEDDPLTEELMRQLLGRAGHDVRVVGTGRKAVELAQTGGFDVLLLDLHLPAMDGFEVVAAIRAHERRTGAVRLPVIATTARSQREVHEACLAAGMDRFLVKPVSSAMLRAALAAVAGTAPRAPSLIDAPTLLATCGHDDALLAALTRTMVAGLPSQLAQLARAFDAGDFTRLRELAHRVCGLVAPFSTIARDVAAEIEDGAAAQAPAVAEPLARLAALGPALIEQVNGVTVEELRVLNF